MTCVIIIQNFCKCLTALVFYLSYRVEYIGRHNIPKKEKSVIAANHSSYLDTVLITDKLFGRIFWGMAKNTLFKSPIIGLFLRFVGAFPVNRDSMEKKSLKTFLQLMAKNQCVVIFPEGTRTQTGELQPGKIGTGMIIHKAKTKVVPVYVHGTFTAWPKGQKFPKLRKRIIITFGEEIDFTKYFTAKGDKEIYQQITDVIMESIKTLKESVLAKLEMEKNN